MKKIIRLFIIVCIFLLFEFFFKMSSFADSLNTISVRTDKTIIRPGENVSIIIEFGQNLGSYSFNVQYDNNLFEFLSADGGIANNSLNNVDITYNDATNPRNVLNVVFKAKNGITTSNPTDFLITAENLFNSNLSNSFDSIRVPIIKNVTVEPEYKDYVLKLSPIENIIKGEETEIIISYSSEMGRYFEHARLVAEAETPNGAFVKIIGEDQNGIKQDIIQSGWEDINGYPIGGQNVISELHFRGIFSNSGNYKITLKLIDRDNSDSVIQKNQFQILVIDSNENNENLNSDNKEIKTLEESGVVINENVDTGISNIISNDITSNEKNVNNEINNNSINETQLPNKLPKTGMNFYVHIIVLSLALISVFAYAFRKK